MAKRASAGAASASPVEEDPMVLLVTEFALDGVPLSCGEMLLSALPHALATPSEERHAYQTAILASFSKLCAAAQQRRTDDVANAEHRVESVASERQAAAEQVEAALKEVDAKTTAKAAATSSENESNAALVAAQAAVVEEKNKVEQGHEETRRQIEARATFERSLAEHWEALKTGAFAPKDWRQRNKAIEAVSALLGQAEAPGSLVAAAQVALKEKPEARSPFGVQAVDAAQEAAQAHLVAMQRGSEEQEAATAAQGEAVATAAVV